MAESIKAKVITLAQGDPFLTVDELSERSGTTSRYVRTILSEAGLSLNKLRRQYARRLEKRLGEEAGNEPEQITAELEIIRITGKEVHSSLCPWGAEEKLFQLSALGRRGDLLVYEQIVTPTSVTVCPDYINLRQLLPNGGELTVGEQKIEVVRGSSLNSLLALAQSEPVFRLSSVLLAQGEIAALERLWFGLEGVSLRWSRQETELKVHHTG